MKDAVNVSFSPGSSRPSPSMLSREDYWSEEATFTRKQLDALVDLGESGIRTITAAQKAALGSAWPFV